MNGRYILTDYVEYAMSLAVYEKLEEASFAGHIPQCTGLFAFGTTLHDCQEELRSVLEGWILLGLKLGHTLPVLDGIDLNQAPVREPLESL